MAKLEYSLPSFNCHRWASWKLLFIGPQFAYICSHLHIEGWMLPLLMGSDTRYPRIRKPLWIYEWITVNNFSQKKKKKTKKKKIKKMMCYERRIDSALAKLDSNLDKAPIRISWLCSSLCRDESRRPECVAMVTLMSSSV